MIAFRGANIYIMSFEKGRVTMTWGEFIRKSDEELAHFFTHFVRESLSTNRVYGELEEGFEQKLLMFLQEEMEDNYDPT